MMIKNLLHYLHLGLWELRGGPRFSSFKRSADEMRHVYSGRAVDLFFGNQGETIHKWPHYLPIYESVLGCLPPDIRFLELGVFKGGSMKLWREFFGPDATIFGIDVDPDCKQHDGKYGSVRIGSQDDGEFLRSVVQEMGKVDVILDDGSHVARHQRASFEILFPLLEDGGLYVIEDTHTSYWPSYGGGLRRRGTAIEFVKDKIDAMHRHYRKAGTNNSEDIPEIESIQFFDSIIVIKKKRQLARVTVMSPEIR
jgi:cephalosporin hydroxylase